MEVARPIPGWRPSTPAVGGRALDELVQQHPAIAVHLWAPWNGVDPLMDRSIQAVASQLAGRVYFVSCDVDTDEGAELCRRWGVVNVPALAVLLSGELRRFIVGYLPPEHLAGEIESRLRDPEGRKRWWAFWQ